MTASKSVGRTALVSYTGENAVLDGADEAAHSNKNAKSAVVEIIWRSETRVTAIPSNFACVSDSSSRAAPGHRSATLIHGAKLFVFRERSVNGCGVARKL